MDLGRIRVKAAATSVPRPEMGVSQVMAEDMAASLPFRAVSTTPVARPVNTPENRP